MPFADTSYPVRESSFKRTEWISLGSGTHIIRVLEPEAYDTFTHYVKGYTVKCLEDNCPICANNRLIYGEYPETYRDEPGYIGRRKLFYVNVLDKTPAKVCPNCGNEIKAIKNVTCPKCDTALPEAEPLNKVKVLSKGVQLFELLDALDKGVLDPKTHEKIGITHFDIVLTVSGTGRDKKISPIHSLDLENLAEEEIDPELLFDTSTICMTLEPAEMLDLQRGISPKDIFAARRAKEDAESDMNFFGGDDDDEEVLSEESKEDVRNAIDALFDESVED